MDLTPGIDAVQKLIQMGYRFSIQRDGIDARYGGQGKPDRRQVVGLLALIKINRAEAMAYIAKLVCCRDCSRAEVGRSWAICHGTPWDEIPGQALDHQHLCHDFEVRPHPLPSPEPVLLCRECFYYRDNPWTHYSELPAWCDWHFDHLATDNPACLN